MECDFTQPAPGAKVCVCGSLNADLIAYEAAGQTGVGYSHGRSFELGLGGKGFNVAVSVAATGVDCHLVGRLGKDVFGGLMQRKLSKSAVHDEFVLVDPKNQTGVGHVRVNADGDYDTCVVAGANGAVDASDVDRALGSGIDFTHLVLEFEIPVDTALYAAKQAKARGMKVVLNASPVVAGAARLLPFTDVLVVNENEAFALWVEVEARDVPWPTKLWDVMDELRKAGGSRDVVVTLGSKGVWAITAHGEMKQLRAHNVETINAVGAGDSFLAMLVSTLAQGQDLLEGLGAANAAGALACTRAESWLDSRDGPKLNELLQDGSVVLNPRLRRTAR